MAISSRGWRRIIFVSLRRFARVVAFAMSVPPE